MTRRYIYTGTAYIEVAYALETEVDLEVAYSVTPRTLATYGQPAEDPTIEVYDVRLTRDGAQLEVPSWLSDLITGSDSMMTELLAHARDVDACAANDAADAKREMAREAAE